MRRVFLPIAIGLLACGLFVSAVAMAAPSQPPVLAAETGYLFDTITPTTTVSDTVTFTHPVASAIATYFGPTFNVDYNDIMGLHEQGLGFGVIAKAYFVAQTLEISGITPTDVISQFQSGTGWGVIIKGYGLHPGLGKGSNLGAIMSGRKNYTDTLGAPWMPPGQLKKSQDPASQFVPPGQQNKSGNGNDGRGGPPDSPPGKAKGKDKN